MFLYKIYLSIFIFYSRLLSLHCQENATNCFDQYTISFAGVVRTSFTSMTSNLTSLVVSMPEAIAEDTILYYIFWIDSTYPTVDNITDTNSALEYLKYIYTDVNLSVYVGKSMKGIMDYNNTNRQEYLELSFYFDFSNVPDSPCKLQIEHDILDNNTDEPHFAPGEYSLSVREDFPVLLTISDFQLMGYDYDATSPNNMFSVTASSGCPLQATELFYTCNAGIGIPVTFELGTVLDYDTMEPPFQHNCNITLKDSGMPPKMTTSTIVLNVTSFQDEDPVFTSDFYTGYLDSSLAGSVVKVNPIIDASDPDVPPTSVSYSMTSADGNVTENDYFLINSLTGEITVIQDIDNDFLFLETVTYILTACDADDQCANSYLSINLPVQAPPGSDSLEFEKDTYAARTVSPSLGETVLQVHAQSSDNQENVRYSFVDDASLGLQYFEIDEITGEITTTNTHTLIGFYVLQANATNGNLTDFTTVNIEVVLQVSDGVIVDESIVFTTVQENSTSGILIYTVTGERAAFFCILDVRPESFNSYFEIQDDGEIITTKTLNADDVNGGNVVKIKAAAYPEFTSCVQSSISTNVLHNEVLIELEIIDVNENGPYFINPIGEQVGEILYAYPMEVALQKAIGPAATVMGRDTDITENTLRYTMEEYLSYYAYAFDIDYSSGGIYLIKDMNSTMFNVLATDSIFTSYLLVTMEVLPLSYISTMYFDNVNQSEIESKILEVSAQAKVNVYLLYSNLIIVSDIYWRVEAQVYSTEGLKLIDWQQLKNKMVAAGLTVDVISFSDVNYYIADVGSETTDFKTSTIVLGCVGGLLLLLVTGFVGFTVWHKKMHGKPGAKITTLGQAYANEDFRDDDNEPAFATIFGSNPVDGDGPRDSIRRTSTTQITKRGSIDSQEPSTSYGPYKSRISPGTRSTTYVESPRDADVLETGVALGEVHQKEYKSSGYPSLDTVDKSKIEAEKSVYPEKYPRSEFGQGSSYIASAPALESDSEIESSISSDKKSNIKVSMEPDRPSSDEEPKSVAFKILVDTKEFEPDSKL